jgi:hypothetical protein
MKKTVINSPHIANNQQKPGFHVSRLTLLIVVCAFSHFTHPTSQYGAHNQNRTDDLILTMDALYLLSYVGV